MARTFKINKKDGTKVVEGASPLSITGVAANTQVAAGDYVAVALEDGKESDPVDISAFKTLAIAVTGVTLTPVTLTGNVGETGKLTAKVSPDNATDKSVNFTSSDETVATVDGTGKVTYVKAGTVDITVKTKDGNKTAKSVVTVSTP